MHDPKAFWLILTNVLLGVAVLLLLLGIVTGVLCDLAASWRRRHKMIGHLDEEVRSLFHDHSKPVGRHRT